MSPRTPSEVKLEIGHVLFIDIVGYSRLLIAEQSDQIYLGLGEKEKCLDWLEKSYYQQDSACWYLKIDQIYEGVRNEPRLQALVTRIFGSNL